jgi:glycosyl transferase, family 25
VQIPIFVINLDRSEDRFAAISKRLAELDLRFERVCAVEGAKLSTGEKQKISPRRFWRHSRTDGEIGCFASHLRTLQLVVERNLPSAIIMEDDAQIDDDFPLWADAGAPFPPDYDVIKLEGVHFPRDKGLRISHAHGRSIVFCDAPNRGAACYRVTCEGARKGLSDLTVMRGALDIELFGYWRTGLNIYEIIPHPCTQSLSNTTISGRYANRPSWVHRAGKRYCRLLPKNYWRIRRELYQLSRFGIRYFSKVPMFAFK